MLYEKYLHHKRRKVNLKVKFKNTNKKFKNLQKNVMINKLRINKKTNLYIYIVIHALTV